MKQPRQSPQIALSTRAGLTGSFPLWTEIANLTRVAGLDLDLSSRPRRFLLHAAPWPEALRHPAVRAIWLRASQLLSDGYAAETCIDAVSNPASGEKTIVVQQDAILGNGAPESVIKAVARWRNAYPESVAPRVALALAPTDRSGGREHLQRLQLIRYLAAEWDLDLALDLLGRIDETWEAEAAVVKIAPRLRVLRIPYPIVSPVDTTRNRMAKRVLTAAIDSGYDGIISIAPPLKPWNMSRHVVLDTSTEAVMALRRQIRTRGSVTLEPPWRESMF
ncbi:MAG TPA: hypothetical protein VFL82_07965 [Thermomicrobiales bacterium]|nr:hypothetical protein [Thermomicrobiales bacterium]